jgi:AcrR family transcriptional regulator
MWALSTSPRGPNAPFHHGDLRQALVEATTGLIERDGPASVSLREAARITGVSHNAPYRHFPTREALLAAVAENGFRRLRAAFEEAAAAPDDRLLALGQAYVRFASANPGLFRLMFGGDVGKDAHPDLRRAAGEAFALLREAGAQGGSDAPREAALGAWALVHGLAHLVVDDQLSDDLREDAADGRLLERIVQVFGPRTAGVRRRP